MYNKVEICGVNTATLKVLTESEKFQKRGTVPLALDPTRTTVVTDAALGDAMETELKSKGMDVVTV